MADESKTDAFTGTILVIGSTGYIGQSTVNNLSSSVGTTATIRAGARNPESDKAKALAALPGVTAVKADMANAASVTEAATGADVVIIITPGSEDRADLAVAAAKASVAAGVNNIVFVSVPRGSPDEGLFARQFVQAEAGVREAAPTSVALRLPFFTDNFFGQVGAIKGTGKFYLPVPTDAAYGTITVGDAGAAFAAVATNFAKYAGKNLTLVSHINTNAELAAAASKALGKEVGAVQVPPEAAKEALLGMGFQEWQADGVLELWKLVTPADSKLVATLRESQGDLESIIGRKGTSFADWFEAVKGAFVAAAEE